MAHALVIDPAAVARAAARQPSDASGLVQTVTGPIAAARLGLTLMHEHVLVDFIGADQVSPQRYDADTRSRPSCLTCSRPDSSAARRSSNARPPTWGATSRC